MHLSKLLNKITLPLSLLLFYGRPTSEHCHEGSIRNVEREGGGGYEPY